MVKRIEGVLETELEYSHVKGFPHPLPPWDPTGRPKSEKRDRRRPSRPGFGGRRR